MSEPILQLFVAAPSPAARRPYYKRDVLNLCTYPVNSRLNLAFKKKWIPDSVLAKIDLTSSVLAESMALVIYCEEQTDKSSGAIYCFHVVRKARLLRAIDNGIAVTFELDLQAFVAPEVSTSDVHQQLVAQSTEHPNYLRIDATRADPRAKFVRLTADNLRLRESTDWNEVVQRLTDLNGISDSLFFIATDSMAYQQPLFPLGARQSSRGDRTEATIRRGGEISLQLYAVPGDKMQFRAPTTTLSDSVGRVSGPEIRQYGNGYFLLYYVNVKSGWDDDRAMFRICISSDTSGDIIFGSPEIAVHLKVKARLWMIIAIVALLGLGGFLTSLDKETMQSILELITPDKAMAESIVKSWFLTLKIFGPRLIALGAFLGFRKLPGPGNG
jgi:hypothetical protein